MVTASALPPESAPRDAAPAAPAAPTGAPSAAASAAPATDRADAATESAGAATRAALVRAALDLFGRKGYDATSTRDIAAAARANIAGIAYHFGGKAGLHRACAEAIVATVGGTLAALEAAFAPPPESLSPDQAATAVRAGFTVLARFMLASPEAEAVARFLVREQMDPTPAFDVLYADLFRPRHERMCALWARATGEAATDEGVVLAVSAAFGQIMFFRVGRATALRRLDWDTIDDARVERVLAVVLASLDATIAARRALRRSP